jgi:hypothetical protein
MKISYPSLRLHQGELETKAWWYRMRSNSLINPLHTEGISSIRVPFKSRRSRALRRSSIKSSPSLVPVKKRLKTKALLYQECQAFMRSGWQPWWMTRELRPSDSRCLRSRSRETGMMQMSNPYKVILTIQKMVNQWPPKATIIPMPFGHPTLKSQSLIRLIVPEPLKMKVLSGKPSPSMAVLIFIRRSFRPQQFIPSFQIIILSSSH